MAATSASRRSQQTNSGKSAVSPGEVRPCAQPSCSASRDRREWRPSSARARASTSGEKATMSNVATSRSTLARACRRAVALSAPSRRSLSIAERHSTRARKATARGVLRRNARRHASENGGCRNTRGSRADVSQNCMPSSPLAVGPKRREGVPPAAHRMTELIQRQGPTRRGHEHAAPDPVVTKIRGTLPRGRDRADLRDRSISIQHDQAGPAANDPQITRQVVLELSDADRSHMANLAKIAVPRKPSRLRDQLDVGRNFGSVTSLVTSSNTTSSGIPTRIRSRGQSSRLDMIFGPSASLTTTTG